MISENKDFSMSMEMNLKIPAEQYIADKKGNPTAVIIPVENFLSMLEEIEDYRELKNLSQNSSILFKRTGIS